MGGAHAGHFLYGETVPVQPKKLGENYDHSFWRLSGFRLAARGDRTTDRSARPHSRWFSWIRPGPESHRVALQRSVDVLAGGCDLESGRVLPALSGTRYASRAVERAVDTCRDASAAARAASPFSVQHAELDRVLDA